MAEFNKTNVILAALKGDKGESGDIKGVVDNVSDLPSSGDEKNYVVTATGHWYYWRDNTWNDGGVYQATEIANNSVTIGKLSDEIRNYLYNLDDVEYNGSWQQGNIYNGFLVDSNIHISTDYFAVTKGTKITCETGYFFNVNRFDKDTLAYIDREIDLQNSYTSDGDYQLRISVRKNTENITTDDAPEIHIINYVEKEIKIYRVGATRQYTSFTDCIKALKDNANEKIIYVDEGTYDIFEEFGGSNFALSIQDGTAWDSVCPIIPPNTTIIGLGDVIFNFLPTESEIGSIASKLLSPINVKGTCHIENITINGDNCRYCIHDETGGDSKYIGAKKSYKNVRLNKANTCGIGYGQAYACGFDANQTFEFDSCIINSVELPMSFHDRYMAISTCGVIEIKNCIIKSSNLSSNSIRFGNICEFQRHHKVLISSCYLNSEVYIYDELGRAKINNFDVTVLNCNKGITLDESMTTNIYPLDVLN